MTWWSDLVAAEPGFAARVRARFAVRKHGTMATLRRDGSPRISGTEFDFGDDGQLRLGSMAGAVKALDLRRDPRVALHSPTEASGSTPATDPPPSRLPAGRGRCHPPTASHGAGPLAVREVALAAGDRFCQYVVRFRAAPAERLLIRWHARTVIGGQNDGVALPAITVS
ncbi:pyridoxamine 5'-phosphate oxidase family protein [Micromonospora sp. CNB394]|uniref:pyridoxamine 5'-phosphate oxidase family protein n=1 Tax=Micromonospora sp. CNB394 TaxID=1169151 RepID=UPI000372EE90|nr:pyridoxamine 5'-phosphate oxidase family protein [Micromonospora sp. CNB394]